MANHVSCIWKDPNAARDYRTGVSLHSHTSHSKEKLQFIPAFADKWTPLRRALDHLCAKSPVPADFSRGYWTPPLTPRRALEVERKQIKDGLGIDALVSITDHDSIQAPAQLQLSEDAEGVPLSLEWSVPFRGTVFHLGIHNLPPERAHSIIAELNACTGAACEEHAGDLLTMLDAIPEVLIVFNHPLWDLADAGAGNAPCAKSRTGAGPVRHLASVEQFLERTRGMLHALELNGMRKWTENRHVKPLADRWGLPVISGGDRHACEPSASVNLTNAGSFCEFVHEIRVEQRSHVLFMAQYAEPMCLRVLHSLIDVIREYPESPEGHRRWDDRVFHPDSSGTPVALSSMWTKPPAYLDRMLNVFRLAENTIIERGMRQVYSGDTELLLPEPASEIVF